MTIPWDKLHGAVTHFPIALVLFSTACEFAALAVRKGDVARGLKQAGFYSILLAALGGIAAAVTGIILSKGDLWGSGSLLWHHRFVWPALALVMFLAVWRLIVRGKTSRVGTTLYLFLLLVASLLISGAGYWGGEILLGGAS